MDQQTNMDRLIQGIESITKNRCSLTETERALLNEVVELLEEVRLEKRLAERQELIIRVTEIILQIFLASDDIKNLIESLF